MRVDQIFRYPQLFVTGDGRLYFRGTNHYIYSNSTNQLSIVSNNNVALLLDSGGNVGVLAEIYHQGDTNTVITFTDDHIEFKAGGLDVISINGTGVGFYGTAPAAQHAAIADATDAASAITQLNLALAALRATGYIAT